MLGILPFPAPSDSVPSASPMRSALVTLLTAQPLPNSVWLDLSLVLFQLVLSDGTNFPGPSHPKHSTQWPLLGRTFLSSPHFETALTSACMCEVTAPSACNPFPQFSIRFISAASQKLNSRSIILMETNPLCGTLLFPLFPLLPSLP